MNPTPRRVYDTLLRQHGMADLLVMLGATRSKAENLVTLAMQRQRFADVDDLAYGFFSRRYDRETP